MNYEEKRKELLAKAEAAVNEHRFEDFQQLQKDIEALDEGHQQELTAKANLAALSAEAAPVMLAKVSTPVNGVVGDKVNFTDSETEDADWRGSNEYRKAFKNFVMSGTEIPEKFRNAGQTTTTGDVGAVIPSTITKLIIPKLSKAGKIWSRVSKTNIKGGVPVPISTIRPEASWVGERETADTQKAATKSVVFTWNKLICKVGLSLETSVVTIDEFEAALAESIVEAMRRKGEWGFINGKGTDNKQPIGILTVTPPEGQTIEIAADAKVTYADFVAAEAAIPEEYEDALWFMSKKTYFKTIVDLTDKEGRPLSKEINGIDGKPVYTIFGREVVLLPSSYISKYADTVTEDTIFAFMYDFRDYGVNTNREIGIREYIDEQTDDIIKKAVMLTDGKPLITDSLVTMVKKNT